MTALETADLAALSNAAIAAVSTQAIAALEAQHIQALTTAQIAALSTAQVQALTTAQIVALSTSQIVALEPRDIAVMTGDQVAGFEAEDIGAMSAKQIDALILATPIMLDLNGDGIRTLAAAQGVLFDLAGTGHASRWGWAAGGDGLLVRDRNHDGLINDGTELYGQATLKGDGTRAGNGYAAMALDDTNHDGHLNATDAHWKELQVWVDANHDGKTDQGELHALADFGIAELDLQATAGTSTHEGNLIGLVSSYTKTDGSLHAMADVWFAKDVALVETAQPALITATHRLTMAHADLLVAPRPELYQIPSADPIFQATAVIAAASNAAGQRDCTASESEAPTRIDRRLLSDGEPRVAPLI